MKKFIFLILLMASTLILAEKYTTDGKSNLDKLRGVWESCMIEIYNKNGKWYALDIYPTSDDIPIELKKTKEGVYVIADYYDSGKHYYFTWDTKYKTMVEVDKNGNIIKKEQRTVKCLHNNTCG